MEPRRLATIVPAALIALAAIAWAYWPGLSGPFLFDDYANLDVIGAYGHINSWPTFFYYLTSGTADPTGRPIALLTFLLDATTWPAAPWPFKRTNLALHLANTALLAITTMRLQAWMHARRRPQWQASPWTPLLAAVLWGAHPFFVSTTLYVVQREAMLPLAFILLAVLAWDRAVIRFGDQRNVAGWAWAILGTGGATLLATLSKANGVLAPLLVGLAYLWFMRPPAPAFSKGTRSMDQAAALCLALPSLLVLAYLLNTGWQLWAVPQLPGRDWTLPERLLSEPRALWDYAWRLAIPRAGGGGVYVDGFAASRGWLEPATTLPALLMLLASGVAAVLLRNRFPIASFSWAFFLAAHLVESTTIPLELYFEHRNYVPAAFLAWPLAWALLCAGDHQRIRSILAVTIVAGLLLLTHQRAIVWGNEALLTALAAEHQTDSVRSQVLAATNQVKHGQVEDGLVRIHAMQRRHPGSVDIAINAVAMECAATGALDAGTFERARHALATARDWNYGLYEWMHDAAYDRRIQDCQGFGLTGLRALVASAQSNPQSVAPGRKRDLWHVLGRIALADGQPGVALHWFNAALLAEPNPEYALVQAAALGSAGAQAQALEHLDIYAGIDTGKRLTSVRDIASLHAWLLQYNGYYHKEFASLRSRLRADMASSSGNRETP